LTQVFFYHGAADKLAAAGALLGKAAAQKKPVLVYAPEAGQAGELDRLLWTQNALAFIPHCRADSPLAPETPILICERMDTAPTVERLMNLGAETPPDFDRFASLIEVVGADENDRAAGRQRARLYKEQGHEVQFIDLSERA